MIPTTTTNESAAAATGDLRRAGMDGEIALPGESKYDQGRRIWNGAVESKPAIFVFCEGRDDVQAAVRAARKHNLPLSVRCGGHDINGRALRDNGLVIDLSRMRTVEVDANARTAVVGGGATAGDAAQASGPYGLIPVTGAISAVGVAGLTLGGGYSPVSGKFGLALDNLLAAEVVLADGELVNANPQENPDLYWALRGGGGNFGVLTSMLIRLHPVHSLLAGLMLFPLPELEQVLAGYVDLAKSAPEELGVGTGIIPTPANVPAVMVASNWIGEVKEGEQWMAALRHLGTPLFEQVGWSSYAEMLTRFDGSVVNGRHYATQTRWLPGFTPAIVDVYKNAIDEITSPLSILVWHHFRGAGTRIPLEATAFGLRAEHVLSEIVPAWEPGAREEGEIHRKWARDLCRNLGPLALPGGYPNMMNSDDHDQITHAYGANRSRLLALKQRFDPDGVFTSTIPLA